MELRELRYFLAVASEGSITKASQYLHIAQPSLTRTIQKLEDEVGEPLFIRGARKIKLTEKGLLLVKRAEALLDLYSKMEGELTSKEEEVHGDVYIGGGESIGFTLIAKAIAKVQKAHPHIHFHLYSGDASIIKEKLDQGLIDFALFIDFNDLETYEVISLPLKDTWGVYMKRDDALAAKDSITKEDLMSLPLITSKQSLSLDSELNSFFDGKLNGLNIIATYNLLYNASLLAYESSAYLLCLDKLINISEDSPLVFRPLTPKVETRLDLVYKKYSTLSKSASIFLNKLLEAIE